MAYQTSPKTREVLDQLEEIETSRPSPVAAILATAAAWVESHEEPRPSEESHDD